jgi:hypothetical protein
MFWKFCNFLILYIVFNFFTLYYFWVIFTTLLFFITFFDFYYFLKLFHSTFITINTLWYLKCLNFLLLHVTFNFLFLLFTTLCYLSIIIITFDTLTLFICNISLCDFFLLSSNYIIFYHYYHCSHIIFVLNP